MFSQQAMQSLHHGEKVIIPVQEEKGSFVKEDEDLLIFSTPVLESVEYIPPTLDHYVEKMLDDPYMQNAHLFILFDEEKKSLFLEGIWDMSLMQPGDLTKLISQVREIALEVKGDIYKALCQDLVYVLANKSQRM